MGSTKVLIVDDDNVLLTSLKSALSEAGYEVFVATNADEAKSVIQYYDVKIWIVDCLLPGESGIDFVKSLVQSGVAAEKLILMSAMFTDNSFIKDSIAETGATDFLVKPFDIAKLIRLLPKNLGLSQEEDHTDNRRLLYQIFGETKRDQRRLRKLFEQIDVIHGFDLPLVYNLLMESHLSGFLNLTSEDGRIFGVNFADGEIVGVDLEDKETFLGKLLIEHGFLLSGDLESILSQKGTRKLGESLIQEHIISPHALDIAMAEQMSLRLSRTIIDQEIKFNFSEAQVDKTRPSINTDLFNNYLHDWINSKLNLFWLRAQLTEWRFSILKKAPNCDVILSHLNQFPLFQSYEEIKNAILEEQILEDLFKKHSQSEEELLKMTFLLLAKGAIYFEEKDISEFSNKVESLTKLRMAIESLDPKEAISFLANQVGSTTENLDVLKTAVFNFLAPFEKSKSDVVKKQVKFVKDYARTHLVKIGDQVNSQKEKINASMEAMRLFEEGKALIAKGKFIEARKILQESIEMYPKLPKQKLYLLWSQIQSCGPNVTKENIKDFDASLLKIDPEDKHEALYHFIQGLVFKVKSQRDLALRAFEKALALDAHFIEARRELMILKSKGDVKKSGVLDADIKTLVGQLFSRKRP